MQESRRDMAPVFLVGSERSGSTLLALMLDHHPDLAWAQGLEFAVAQVTAPGQWPPLEQYYDFLDTDRIFQTSGLTVARGLDYLAQMHDFIAQEARRKHKPLAGALVHRNFARLPWIFPEGRYLHLVRDGRDVSRSAVGFGFVGNLWRGACWWLDAERSWDDLEGRIRAGQFHEVRYEKLIRSPEETLRDICGFIGVPYSERMFDYTRTTSYRLPDPNLIEQWRTKLTPHEVRIIEAVAAPMLEARGYALSGLPRLRIGRAYRLCLREDDRFHRVRNRVARDGFWLTAAEFLARRLHLKSIHRRLRLRLNENEKRHIR